MYRTIGMLEHPDKYPDSVIVFGSAPTSIQRSGIEDVMERTAEAIISEDEISEKSDYWKFSQFVQSYHHELSDKYPSCVNTHATALALTLRADGSPTIGIFDNGRKQVVEFSVCEFARTLRRFWNVYYFNVELN